MRGTAPPRDDPQSRDVYAEEIRGRCTSAVSILDQRRKRWLNIETTLAPSCANVVSMLHQLRREW